MKLIQPVEAREMRLAIINGIGAALGFLMLYLIMERISPKFAWRLPGGPNSGNG